MGRRLAVTVPGLLLCLALAPRSAAGGGFSFDAQGARALGMAGAFTAQADDPTAIFHNPGGLVLFREYDRKKFAFGAAGSLLAEGLFQGLPPGPAAGTAGEQEMTIVPAGHAYFVQNISPRLTFGISAVSPFLMDTEWSDPDTFSGRFISVSSEIRTLDVNPVLALRIGDRLGIGVGVVYRIADFELERRVPTRDALGNPIDVATLAVNSGTESAVGWNAGLRHRVSDRFAWGATYRSAMTVDFTGGEVELTQISTGDPQLDAAIRATFPFDQALPFSTSLELPATASVGVALGGTWGSLVELDVDWTGWSRFQEVAVSVPTEPALSFSIPEDFDDSLTYRLGYRYATREGTEWRLGYAFDESPQPTATVGPFFADGDRNIVTAGVGRGWLDVGVGWIDVAQRLVTDSESGFNGNYRSSAWVAAVTISR